MKTFLNLTKDKKLVRQPAIVSLFYDNTHILHRLYPTFRFTILCSKFLVDILIVLHNLYIPIRKTNSRKNGIPGYAVLPIMMKIMRQKECSH